MGSPITRMCLLIRFGGLTVVPSLLIEKVCGELWGNGACSGIAWLWQRGHQEDGRGENHDSLDKTSWNTSMKMILIANARAKIGRLVSQGSA